MMMMMMKLKEEVMIEKEVSVVAPSVVLSLSLLIPMTSHGAIATHNIYIISGEGKTAGLER